ncbi:MAG: hypothetical protein ACXVRZ_12245 [Gaiellaceae bacterium]
MSNAGCARTGVRAYVDAGLDGIGIRPLTRGDGSDGEARTAARLSAIS